MMVISIFPFSHIVLYSSQAQISIFDSFMIILLSANALDLDQLKILSFGRVKPPPLPNTQFWVFLAKGKRYFTPSSWCSRQCSYFPKSAQQDQPTHTCSLILLYTIYFSIINFCPLKPIWQFRLSLSKTEEL